MVSLGKFRNLAQCSTPEGHFVVLAIDHRANLKDTLSAARGVPVDDAELSEFKHDVVQALGEGCSAVLGDPGTILGRGIASGALRGGQGLLTPVEITNYAAHPSERAVQFIPGWNVEKAKRVGVNGIKLLVYFHPRAATAREKLKLVELLVTVCGRYDIPLFIEPILHPLNAHESLDTSARIKLNAAMARAFAKVGADVLKVEFPVDTSVERDEKVWQEALQQVNEACGSVPWTLLSGGVDFSTFVLQVKAACAAGASGVIVGRAVWNSAIKAVGPEGRAAVLEARAKRDLAQLAGIVRENATSWWDKTGRPPADDLSWYEYYSGFNGSK